MECNHYAAAGLTCYECYKKSFAKQAHVEQRGVIMNRLNTSCDQCSAAALVEVRSDQSGFTLYFCGHHYQDQEDALVTSGFAIIQDDRAQLVAAGPTSPIEVE